MLGFEKCDKHKEKDVWPTNTFGFLSLLRYWTSMFILLQRSGTVSNYYMPTSPISDFIIYTWSKHPRTCCERQGTILTHLHIMCISHQKQYLGEQKFYKWVADCMPVFFSRWTLRLYPSFVLAFIMYLSNSFFSMTYKKIISHLKGAFKEPINQKEWVQWKIIMV